jgi:hypothetical protein
MDAHDAVPGSDATIEQLLHHLALVEVLVQAKTVILP